RALLNTLLPYTTLFRSGQLMARLWNDENEEPEEWSMTAEIPAPQDDGEDEEELTPGETTMRILETEGSLRSIYNFGHEDDFERRSEEHTSELQSRFDLV